MSSRERTTTDDNRKRRDDKSNRRHHSDKKHDHPKRAEQKEMSVTGKIDRRHSNVSASKPLMGILKVGVG